MQNNQESWNSMYIPGDKPLKFPGTFDEPETITNIGKGYGFKSYDGKEWPTLKEAINYNEQFLVEMKINPNPLLYNIEGRTNDLYDIENRSR